MKNSSAGGRSRVCSVAGNRIHVKRRLRVVFRKQMHAMVRTNIHLCSSLDVSSSS